MRSRALALLLVLLAMPLLCVLVQSDRSTKVQRPEHEQHEKTLNEHDRITLLRLHAVLAARLGLQRTRRAVEQLLPHLLTEESIHSSQRDPQSLLVSRAQFDRVLAVLLGEDQSPDELRSASDLLWHTVHAWSKLDAEGDSASRLYTADPVDASPEARHGITDTKEHQQLEQDSPVSLWFSEWFSPRTLPTAWLGWLYDTLAGMIQVVNVLYLIGCK
jgi:hypothetical protein